MKWTHYVNLFLGVWLIAAPAAFGYKADTVCAQNDIICGFLAIAFALYSLTRLKLWASWMLCLIGIWLQFAPLLFWAKEPVIYLNDTLVGALLIGFAILIPRLPHETEDNTPAIPLGWSYNPSSWTQRLPIIGLACICWFLARYLAGFELGYYTNVWDPIFHDGTREVLVSKVSQAFPVPDAGLGAMAYTLEALLGCKGSEKRWRTMPWIVLIFGLLVVPVGIVSIILVMLQPLVVGAWCFLCLLTAFLMLIMVILTLDEVTATLQYLHWSIKKGHPFWRTFWKGGAIPHGPLGKQTLQEDYGFLGVSFEPRLLITAIIGIILLCIPSYFALTGTIANTVHIIGALSVVVSLIALAEVARVIRFVNMLLGACLLLSLFFYASAKLEWILAIAGILLILLSYPKGVIEEKYGSYKKHIR